MINSFSGAHPFRPQCLAPLIDGERLAAVVELVDAGRCPRCGDPLPDGDPIQPAGSRVTACRCVPICGQCGDAEPVAPIDPSYWPLGADEISEERVWLEEQRQSALPGTTGEDATGGPAVATDGVITPKPRPHPGGWLEYGYDDAADREEREQ
jgi:hypothetical protein